MNIEIIITLHAFFFSFIVNIQMIMILQTLVFLLIREYSNNNNSSIISFISKYTNGNYTLHIPRLYKSLHIQMLIILQSILLLINRKYSNDKTLQTFLHYIIPEYPNLMSSLPHFIFLNC